MGVDLFAVFKLPFGHIDQQVYLPITSVNHCQFWSLKLKLVTKPQVITIQERFSKAVVKLGLESDNKKMHIHAFSLNAIGFCNYFYFRVILVAILVDFELVFETVLVKYFVNFFIIHGISNF